jgi:uncharacterized protein (TIGR03437 family)
VARSGIIGQVWTAYTRGEMPGGLDCFALQFAIFAALSTAAAASSPASTIAHLPNVQLNAAKVDVSGNIYLAGQTTGSTGSRAAYIAKLSPTGASVYATTIGGSGSSATAATVMDIDSTGAVYVAGTTTAPDFPVTTGAVQTTGSTAFAAKLDAKGNIIYAVLIVGNPQTIPRSVAVNSKRELVVSGQTTTGTPTATALALFLLKLSADGTQVVAGPQGIGGLIAIDSQDNVDLAGDPAGASTGPSATPGAFQGAPATSYCGCPFLNFPCGGDQFVASLTPDLSRIRFLTYVTSKFGAVPAFVAVDSPGNIWIAGTTNAPGYPTTTGSYEPNYTASSTTIFTCGPPIPMEVTSPSGYLTVVKPDGSSLVLSTFFSGSKSDSITFGALTASGIYLAGQAGSTDLPGFNGAVPSQCTPLGFVTRMTLDGTAISSSRTPPGTPLAVDPTTGTLLLAYGSDLVRYDPSQPTPIACLLDAADLRPVTAIAPGELLSMFGRFQYFATSPFSVPSPVNGSFPTKSQGLGIAANQTAAPLLYVSEQQLNFQAPYEIAGSSQTNVSVTYADVNGNSISDSRTLQVSASNPVAFLAQPSIVNQSFPLAFNADGTMNSKTDPAAAGSIVTIFLEGLGLTSPPPVTGLVNTSPVALNLPIVVTPYCDGTFCYPAPAFVSANSLTGSISGVIQVQLRVPTNPHPGGALQAIFSLSAGPNPLRDTNLSFWLQ